MTLTSLKFLAFLLFVFLTYFLMPKKIRWIILLIASYIFYLFSSVKLSIFLIISTLTTYLGALLIEKAYNKNKDKTNITKKIKKQLKVYVFLVALINFGILIFLKYSNFIAYNTQALYNLIGINKTIPKMDFLLPLGISFYTFQSIGYVIDVYRKKINAERNLFKYALFVSFFPQIIQGPISRYDQLSSQLYKGNKFNYNNLKDGLLLILWGFFKKMVIADRIGILVNIVFDNYKAYAGLYYVIAVIFYCIQIYADFSGGIDIVRGVSQTLGINLVENFKRPYFAKSVSEFWQRWHITLGTWMKDYVFYPIALSKSFGKFGKRIRKIFKGNFGKQLPASIASLIVFILVGAWHGSSWKYIAFGLYHGFFILTSTLLLPIYTKILKKLKINTESFFWKFFQIIRTFIIVLIGRYFSRAISFKVAIYMLKSSVMNFNYKILFDKSLFKLGLNIPNLLILLVSVFVFFMVSLLQEKGFKIREGLKKRFIVLRWIIYYVLIFSVLVFGVYGENFNVSNFIYQGF